MEFDRDDYEILLDDAGTVRIVVRTGGRPRIDVYAVILQARVEDHWRTVRLIDNHLDRHHMHRYHGGVNGEPEHFAYGAVREVIPQAIDYMREHYRPIIESWTP